MQTSFACGLFETKTTPKAYGMAIFHLSAKIISRKTGRSSTGAAAYRAGEKVIDERTGEVHDYTRKSGIESAQIVMPSTTDWRPDRAELWNAVEQKNKRADAQVAREFIVALPEELPAEERQKLANRFAKEIADRYQIAADVAIHKPSKGGDHRNHHAHILTSTNKINGSGFGNKVRELDLVAHTMGGKIGQATEIEHLRERWATLTNDALQRHGVDARIDHRTLEAQGIVDRAPTQHRGPALDGMNRRGADSFVLQRQTTERLERAKQLGELERERAKTENLIIDLSSDLVAAKKANEVKPQAEPEKVGLFAKVKEILTLKPKPVKTIEPVKEQPEMADPKSMREEKMIHSFVPQAAPVITPEQLKKQYEDMRIREVIETYHGLIRSGVPRNEIHPTLARRMGELEERQAAAAEPKPKPKPVIKPVPPKEVQRQEVAAPAEKPHEYITPEKLTKQYEEMPIKEAIEVFNGLAKVVSRDEIHSTLTRRVDEWNKQQAEQAKTLAKGIEPATTQVDSVQVAANVERLKKAHFDELRSKPDFAKYNSDELSKIAYYRAMVDAREQHSSAEKRLGTFKNFDEAMKDPENIKALPEQKVPQQTVTPKARSIKGNDYSNEH